MKLIIVFGILLVLVLTFLGGYACRAQQNPASPEELQAALNLLEAQQAWDQMQLKKIPEAVKTQESTLKMQIEQRAKNIAELKAQIGQAAPKAAVKK